MTNRPTDESTSIVVALTDPAPRHLLEGLARFADEVGPDGEVVLVDASGTPDAAGMAARFANVRVLNRPNGRLAPELWRDGLLATDASLVALSTAQMVPRPGWIGTLKDRLRESGTAAVGGPIAPGPGLSATDRAVALLRYASYFPTAAHESTTRHPSPIRLPAPRGRESQISGFAAGKEVPVDPPGDNALYRRDRLMAVGSSWLDGFWEVEVHEALRARGESLAMAELAIVDFRGGVALASMLRQRFRHARRYAAGRSSGLGPAARWSRVVRAPLVPPWLGLRAVRALREKKRPLAPWLTALVPMIGLASAWAIGEAIGTQADDRKRRPMPQPIREVA